LERVAKQSRDLVVEDYYEAARGYVLFAKGDLANAAEQLAGNPRSPLALQQLALGAGKTRERRGSGGGSHTAEIPARSDGGVVSGDARSVCKLKRARTEGQPQAGRE